MSDQILQIEQKTLLIQAKAFVNYQKSLKKRDKRVQLDPRRKYQIIRFQKLLKKFVNLKLLKELIII